ncbi:hypothetical protein KFE94_11820 [bacterium SCSIO 12643]|nr:hypothetical protein KFE94_11820 [bacterium SCSIO 12643]
MKKLFPIIIALFLSQALFAQADSVFMNTKSGLFSEFHIIYPDGDLGIRENYSFFKNRYWLVDTDTLSLEIFNVTENGLQENKRRKPQFYQKYEICDTTINLIRNSASYWKMMSDIDQMARNEIGSDNVEFDTYKHGLDYHGISDLSNLCFDAYLINETILETKLSTKILSIKKAKQNRFHQLKNASESINAETISEFLSTFDECSDDLNSLEVIILNKPTLFLQEVEKLDELDFFTFTLKLGYFHEEADLSKMKASLNQCDIQTSRKKKVIRKLNNKEQQS